VKIIDRYFWLILQVVILLAAAGMRLKGFDAAIVFFGSLGCGLLAFICSKLCDIKDTILDIKERRGD